VGKIPDNDKQSLHSASILDQQEWMGASRHYNLICMGGQLQTALNTQYVIEGIIVWVNPHVSHTVPSPIPMATPTHDTVGIPIKNYHKSAKMVKN